MRLGREPRFALDLESRPNYLKSNDGTHLEYRYLMTQSVIETKSSSPVRQENQRDAKRDDVVRLLSSEELAEACDFYDAAPHTD